MFQFEIKLKSTYNTDLNYKMDNVSELLTTRVLTVSVFNQILFSYHSSLDLVPQDFSRSLCIV
jgi:hypothetical protein